MTTIYEQHEAAFKRISAYVICYKGEFKAKIAFKFPADGAGRLFAYIHWLGEPMVRGFANGYGYDKMSAACESAAERLAPAFKDHGEASERKKFLRAIENTGGAEWQHCLEKAGFNIFNAV